MIVVGIDASRNRSGGAIRHMVGILGAGDPRAHGVAKVHVWSYDALLSALPDAEWLVKHAPAELKGSIFRQAWWQRRSLPVEARRHGIDVLLNTDAGTVCRAHPSVTMSRDMTQYEPGEMRRDPVMSRSWLRNFALKHIQNSSLRDADGVVFLTEYAARVIQQATGPLPLVAVIPHGVGDTFRHQRSTERLEAKPVRCVYVSQTEMYKHQWHVVEAVADLRSRGYDLELTLAGGGTGRSRELLDAALDRHDPTGSFVRQTGPVAASKLPALLAESDLFIFASSCENMPNTLVEGMASGLPIACSDRGPMPEVLQDGGAYFDPENAGSIAAAIESILVDPRRRITMARRASELAAKYSWERCAAQTWKFLGETLAFSKARPSR